LVIRIGGSSGSSKSKSMLSGSAVAVASMPAIPPLISRFLRGHAIASGAGPSSITGEYACDQPRPGS
jgi:hypothetical protein